MSNFVVELPSASIRFLAVGPVDHFVFPVGQAFAFVVNLINVHIFGLVDKSTKWTIEHSAILAMINIASSKCIDQH